MELRGTSTPESGQILTPDALRFIEKLEREFGARRRELLKARAERQAAIHPDGKVPPTPADLQSRRVEITGPTDRKMVINALNSGASVFMADFEDANSPTWSNMIEGQINLRDAVAGTIDFTSPEGKRYCLC